MKTYKHLFAIGLIAMLMSVTGLSSVPASAATTWNTSEPKMDISVQSNAQNRTFAIKVYNKSGANYYKVLERGQDSKTGKWTSWTTVKGYYSFSGKYKRFTVAKNASDNKIYHYRLVCYNSNNEEIAIDKRLETAVPSSVKVTSGNDSKTGKAQNTITWSGKIPTGFQLWRATSKNGTYRAMGGSIQANTYTDTNVTEGVTYYYKLRSYKKLASARYYSNYSSIVSVKTNENKIATPTVSSFTYDETKGFTVKYKSNTTSFTGFEVKILDKNNNQVCYKQTDTKTTSVTLNSSNIKANTKYTVQVKAFNTVNGTKKYSSYASKDLTTPKFVTTINYTAPTIENVTFNANMQRTKGNGLINLMFVNNARVISFTDQNGEAINTNDIEISYDSKYFSISKSMIDYDDYAEQTTYTAKDNEICVTPLKTGNSQVLSFTYKNNKQVTSSYTCKIIESAISEQACMANGGYYNHDTVMYIATQIKNNYSQYLTNNNLSDNTINSLHYIYETVCRNRIDTQSGELIGNAYGCLYRGYANCLGTSAAFQVLATTFGYTSEVVRNVYDTHSWNMVQLGDYWYHIDCYLGVDSVFLDCDASHQRALQHKSPKPYYGFACSSQEEYDNAVAKVKTEFKNAINELNTENGYSLKVVDELPSGEINYTTQFNVAVATGKTDISQVDTVTAITKYIIERDISRGDVYINSTTSLKDSSTDYTKQGYITYVICFSNVNATSANKIMTVIEADGSIHEEPLDEWKTDSSSDETENNSNAEDTENSEANEEEPVITPEPTFEPTEDSEVTEDTEETTVSSETDESK